MAHRFSGNDSRSDAQRGASVDAWYRSAGGDYIRGSGFRGFPSYDEAWASGANLLSNAPLLARMPWVLPRVVEDEQLVRRYVSGNVFPCGTPLEAIYSHDWRQRIAVPDSELHARDPRGVQAARERLVGQIKVRHRRHHAPLRAIPRDYGVDAYAFRTLGEIGYVNELVELDVSGWYGDARVSSNALCWATPIIKAAFRYVAKARLFWEWTQWERRIRARTGLFIPYQCIEAESLRPEARNRRYVCVPAWFSVFEMSPGCRAELPPVVTYKGSALVYDPNSGYWAVFYTEWAARVAVWVLWDLYDTYRLWYVPRKLREAMRALKLDFVLCSRQNEEELHRLLSVIASVDWRQAEFRYTSRDTTSYEDLHAPAPGDYGYDPWRRERIDGQTAQERRQHRPEIPRGMVRGFVYLDGESQEGEPEGPSSSGVPASSGNLPVTSGIPPVVSVAQPSRAQSVGMSAFGPVIQTMRETDALDLAVPDNFREVRVFLRDCGVDVNEMPRGSLALKDWMRGLLYRPRTTLCGGCVADLCETCYTGYRNGDPALFEADMAIKPMAVVASDPNVEVDAAAPSDGAEGPMF